MRAGVFALGLALAVAGCKKNVDVTVPPDAVKITVDGKGFSPSSVNLKKGALGTLVFVRTTTDTCATEVVFPELGVRRLLPTNEPVAITVPTDKEQTLSFQCGMGMYKSAVVVTP